MQVTVRDLMTPHPVTIPQTASLAVATQTVLDNAVSEAYVCDENGRLLGLVNDYALLKARMMRMDENECVTRVMSRHLMVLHPQTPLEEIAGVFRDSCHSRMAVVEHGRLLGQLQRRDVLRTLMLLDQLQASSDRIRRVEPASSAAPQRPSFLYPDEPAALPSPRN